MRFISFEKDGKATLGIRDGDHVRVIGDETLESLLARGVDLCEYAKQHATEEKVSAERPEVPAAAATPAEDHLRRAELRRPHDGKQVRAARLPDPVPACQHESDRARAADDSPGVDRLRRPRLTKARSRSCWARAVATSSKEDALSHVAGYSLFNDGSVREYQFKTPQWTVGKNFDGTGAFGPDLVTADELPPGVKGLRLETRAERRSRAIGQHRRHGLRRRELISIISEAITLEAGDVIVSGTPSGIGWARTPQLLMKAGDVCEVTVEKIGTLRNVIARRSQSVRLRRPFQNASAASRTQSRRPSFERRQVMATQQRCISSQVFIRSITSR